MFTGIYGQMVPAVQFHGNGSEGREEDQQMHHLHNSQHGHHFIGGGHPLGQQHNNNGKYKNGLIDWEMNEY
jgi:hypothetical protein